MEWWSPFVIYRVSPDGKLEEVFQAPDIKKARYWLTYIAQPGDVLCRTPIHPKHSKSSPMPEYWSHKEQSGTASSNEEQWKSWAQEHKWDNEFPTAPQSTPESSQS